MYDELIKRLRERSVFLFPHHGESRSYDADLFHEAADAIEELIAALTASNEVIAKNKPQWISAKEPPDNDRNIFICHGSADFKAPCIGHYEPGMKMYYEDKNWFASPIYDAMFWCDMPKLPEPPKEVTNE